MPKLSRIGLQLPIILGVTSLFSGCVIPERIDANITMIGYRYDALLEGQLAEPRTIASMIEGKPLSTNHEEQMKAQIPKALALPGMKQFTYEGEGRFAFAMKVNGELSANSPVVGFPNVRGGSSNFLTIRRELDGTVLISSPEAPAKALAELKQTGVEPGGTITIEVDGRVLSSNADDQPRNGAHVWKRTTWHDRIYLKLHPNKR